MSTYHLTYNGADGIVFDSIQPGHTTAPNGVNLDLRKGRAFFSLKNLPHGPFDPPERVWAYGLPLFFAGSEIDLATGKIEVPVSSLLAPFFNHPASDPIVQEILDRCSPWVSIAELTDRAARFPDGPPIDDLVQQWIGERDRKWAAGSAHHTARTAPYLSWPFLDLIAMAHWDQVKSECRIDTILFALVMAVNEISPSEAEFLAGFDADGLIKSDKTAFNNYLRNRRYTGINRGPLSDEEKWIILGVLKELHPPVYDFDGWEL